MRYLLLIALFIFGSNQSKAQITGNIWYFNDSLGIKFGEKTILKLNDGVTKLNGGTAVLSIDDTLVIYTDGLNLFNSKHNPIQNGTKILGNGVQSTLLLQLPEDSVIHLFTNYFVGYYGKDSSVNGVYHTTLTRDPNNRNNFIVAKTIKLANGSNQSVTAKKTSSFDGYWILFPEWKTSNILIYHLNKNGLRFHKRENVLPQKHIDFSQIKISPNGRYVALMSCNIPGVNESICIYNFDNQKGTLSNYRSIKYFRSTGLEFSPNESFLYIMGSSTRFLTDKISRGIYQVNIDSIQANSTLNKHNSTFIYKTLSDASSMSITPHGQIFITYSSSGRGFSSIMNPDSFGISCDFRIDYIHFDNRPNKVSIPNICIDYILQPYFEIENGCKDSLLSFKIHRNRADSVTWIFGDGVFITNKLSSISHSYSSEGPYQASVILHYKDQRDTISKKIEILTVQKPQLGKDTLLCKGEVLHLEFIDTMATKVVWNNNVNSSQYDVSHAESVIVKVSHDYCSASDTITVSYIECTLSLDSHCFGDSTQFQLAESNLDSAVFDFDNGISCTTKKNTISYKYTLEGKYNPKVRLFLNGHFKEIYGNIEITRIDKDYLSDTVIFCNPTSLIPDLPRNDYYFTWSNNTNTQSLNIESPGLYWLKIERNGCANIDSCFVIITNCQCDVFMPNSFSPNGDNVNDIFSPSTQCEIDDISLNVYNSWGELLIKDATSWDGTYKNSLCPSGVYAWSITYLDAKNNIHHERGTIHLIR